MEDKLLINDSEEIELPISAEIDERLPGALDTGRVLVNNNLDGEGEMVLGKEDVETGKLLANSELKDNDNLLLEKAEDATVIVDELDSKVELVLGRRLLEEL